MKQLSRETVDVSIVSPPALPVTTENAPVSSTHIAGGDTVADLGMITTFFAKLFIYFLLVSNIVVLVVYFHQMSL